jgi:hypothetical protein
MLEFDIAHTRFKIAGKHSAFRSTWQTQHVRIRHCIHTMRGSGRHANNSSTYDDGQSGNRNRGSGIRSTRQRFNIRGRVRDSSGIGDRKRLGSGHKTMCKDGGDLDRSRRGSSSQRSIQDGTQGGAPALAGTTRIVRFRVGAQGDAQALAVWQDRLEVDDRVGGSTTEFRGSREFLGISGSSSGSRRTPRPFRVKDKRAATSRKSKTVLMGTVCPPPTK